ncbi:MAG: hypothetical protein WCD16_04820 [Paracoccaceae bacterium]
MAHSPHDSHYQTTQYATRAPAGAGKWLIGAAVLVLFLIILAMAFSGPAPEGTAPAAAPEPAAAPAVETPAAPTE